MTGLCSEGDLGQWIEFRIALLCTLCKYSIIWMSVAESGYIHQASWCLLLWKLDLP